jgi:hypothetical protein
MLLKLSTTYLSRFNRANEMPDILAVLERSNNTAKMAAESLQHAINVCKDNDANRLYYYKNNTSSRAEAALKASDISVKQSYAAFMAAANAAAADADAAAKVAGIQLRCVHLRLLQPSGSDEDVNFPHQIA